MLRRGCDPRQEGNARGDVFGLIGDVLANIGFGEPQLIGQQESFAVFAQRQLPVLAERVNRHGEKPQIHRLLLAGPI